MQSTSTWEAWISTLRGYLDESHPLDQGKSRGVYTACKPSRRPQSARARPWRPSPGPGRGVGEIRPDALIHAAQLIRDGVAKFAEWSRR